MVFCRLLTCSATPFCEVVKMKRLLIGLLLCGCVWAGTLATFGPDVPPIPPEASGDDVVAVEAGYTHY
jgi:hypothetical protein